MKKKEKKGARKTIKTPMTSVKGVFDVVYPLIAEARYLRDVVPYIHPGVFGMPRDERERRAADALPLRGVDRRRGREHRVGEPRFDLDEAERALFTLKFGATMR